MRGGDNISAQPVMQEWLCGLRPNPSLVCSMAFWVGSGTAQLDFQGGRLWFQLILYSVLKGPFTYLTEVPQGFHAWSGIPFLLNLHFWWVRTLVQILRRASTSLQRPLRFREQKLRVFYGLIHLYKAKFVTCKELQVGGYLLSCTKPH